MVSSLCNSELGFITKTLQSRLSAMDKQLVKRRRGDDDGSTINTDRLSQLPQPVLHNILSLLSQKHAVRTSLLSKSWRYLWHGRLKVELQYNWFRKKEFWPFLDKTLQRYLDQNLSIQQLHLDIGILVDLEIFQKWIPMVIENMGVRSLSLMFSYGSEAFEAYPLPLAFLQSEFLVELHLGGRNLKAIKSTDSVMLNNLRTLRLHFVNITDEVFEKIILGCPLIENLDLLYCYGLKSIKLHKYHIIKNFRCSMDKQTIIEIEDLHTLESFYIEKCCLDWFLPDKSMHFPHLKSLNLYRVHLPETVDIFSSFFPCLSELILKSCDGLKEFRLLSSSIKRLTIKTGPKNKIKAFIDTPNILYFEFSSGGNDFPPSIKFTTTFNEWKSHITLWYMLQSSEKDDTSWLLKLNRLLKSLSQSHITLSLNHMYKKLHIDDSYAGFYKPVVVERVKLCGWIFPSSDPATLNCFFRIIRPRIIHMGTYVNQLAEFICNLIPKEKGSYFWQQDLEEVSIEIRDMKAKNWNCVKGTSLPPLPSKQKIRFRLTWREQ